ncbi:CheR family methyltransferase [Parvularcula lutaonensis]|uniref:Chemotaxis protein methyltransferase n=1 Tax=Parvularcula lutaonensis TaxID=491923 RepID=A0ABV7MCI7_9PROT|nr:protein-glutamate O-methyltransferase [Parvularcula lutaonensis]GGY39336.1 chemotaxis protein methyltransferase [Parvularcula lutaonensis]
MLHNPRAPEFEYTDEDFRQIKGMIYDDAGIFIPDTKMNLVYSRLARRLRALGMTTFYDYVLHVQSRAGREERGHLINALTTNLTHFFREPHHFETARKELVPKALEQTEKGGRFRVWSAGCSTGEEAYSLAITLLDAAPELGKRDVMILGTDIDSNVVEKATKGAYEKDIISPVEPRLRQRFFQTGWGPNADRYVVGDELRAITQFKVLNLMQHWPMTGQFDAIFCRNVVIYFDEATKSVLWDRYANILKPGGLLFIGHSERIGGKARERFEPAGLTTYRKKG